MSRSSTALARQQETHLPLYQEILRGLPLGIVVLQLENPQDAKTFRIIEVNPAATLLTGASPVGSPGTELEFAL